MPGIPGIRLHLASPSSGLGRLAGRSPYWAYPWAGGLALARHLLTAADLVAGRRVLDLGAGSGLVAIAAARAGAGAVLASDIDPYARAASALNAAANGVTLAAILGDLTNGPAPEVDLILAGDAFYDRTVAARVTAFLDRCIASGVQALVGDPGRAFLPRERLRHIADYAVSDFGAGPAGLSSGAVFAFEPPAERQPCP